jgi:putative salt-induced outer membrane protein YdiY
LNTLQVGQDIVFLAEAWRSQMEKNLMLVMITLLLIFLLNGNTAADEVHLKNGDRLTGEVKSLEEDKLILLTSYAGEITITWSEVATLSTDKPITVVLTDESVVEGISQPGEKKEMNLMTEKIEGGVSFNLTDVKSINPKPPEPAVRISARANVGIDVKKGNTDTETYHFDGSFAAWTGKNRYRVAFRTDTEKSSGVETVDNWLGSINYDRFLSEKWFVYGNASFENDQFKDLNLRTFLGMGSGYQFIDTSGTKLSGEAGLSYANDDYIVNEDNSYPAGRLAAAFEKSLFDERLIFFHEDETLVNLEDADDILIRTQTGFRFPFYRRFNMTLQYNWDWEKIPATGRKKKDERYLVTFGYEY